MVELCVPARSCSVVDLPLMARSVQQVVSVTLARLGLMGIFLDLARSSELGVLQIAARFIFTVVFYTAARSRVPGVLFALAMRRLTGSTGKAVHPNFRPPSDSVSGFIIAGARRRCRVRAWPEHGSLLSHVDSHLTALHISQRVVKRAQRVPVFAAIVPRGFVAKPNQTIFHAAPAALD